MSKKIRLDVSKEQLIKDYTELKSIRAIARKYNATHNTVSMTFLDYGLEYSSKPQKKYIEVKEVQKDFNFVLEDYVLDLKSLSPYEIERKYKLTHKEAVSLNRKLEVRFKGPHNKKEMPSKEELQNYYINQNMSLIDMSKIYNVCHSTIGNWLTRQKIKIRSISKAVKLVVPKIEEAKLEKYGYKHFPEDMEYKTSRGENEVKDFLSSIGFTFRSTRNLLPGNLEIDLYNDDLKLAIEYNGELWHSEFNNRGREYHLFKHKELLKQNIRLIMINENEWYTRTDQVKDFLSASLGVFKNRIYARDCIFREMNTSYISFFDKNHIQGIPRNVLFLFGLFYNEELVGAVSISRHHRNTNKTVLSRLCFKSGFQIIGGASKLIKNIIKRKDIQELITWSDNRITDGHLYKQVGFVLDSELPVDYVYVKGNLIKSKQSMKKSITKCPKEITEVEWNKSLGWYRLWDCGKKRWVIKKGP